MAILRKILVEISEMDGFNVKLDPLTWWKEKTKFENYLLCTSYIHPKLSYFSALIATKTDFLDGYFGEDTGWNIGNERF